MQEASLECQLAVTRGNREKKKRQSVEPAPLWVLPTCLLRKISREYNILRYSQACMKWVTA